MREALSRMTPQQRDLVIRTIVGEAANQGERGMQAVAAVIGNRMAQSGRGGDQVVLAPNQFEPWGNASARARMQALTPDSPRYQQAAAAVDALARGGADPTGGATHFYAPRAQAALGRRPPSWDNGTGVDIGDHRFFRLGYGGSGAGNRHGIATPAAAPQTSPSNDMMAGLMQTPQSAASPRPANGGEAIARAIGAPDTPPAAASAYAPGQAPQPQPRPRMSPEEFQREVFTNGPNTGNEAQDFNLQQDALRRGYASWAPGLNSPQQAPAQSNPLDAIRSMFPQPSDQNALLARLLNPSFGAS